MKDTIVEKVLLRIIEEDDCKLTDEEKEVVKRFIAKSKKKKLVIGDWTSLANAILNVANNVVKLFLDSS